MRAPSALAAVPLVGGCAAGLLWFDPPPPFLALSTAGAAAIAVLAALGAWLDGEAAGAGLVLGALLCGVSLGVSAGDRVYRPSLLEWFHARQPGDPVVIDGTLREDAAVTLAGISIVVDVTGIADGGLRREVSGGVRVSVSGSLAAARIRDWRAGRRVRVPATLRRPTSYRNPGVQDDARALARRGVVLVGSVKSGALVDVLAPGAAMDEASAAVRAWTRARLSALVGRRSARSAAIASAILIGDRTGLAPDDERRLQEAGTYHVIAISGGNIAILTVVVLAGLRLLAVPRAPAAAIAIAALIFYGQVAGHAASVGRAVAAAVIFLAGRLIDHRGAPLNALGVAALLVVGAAPEASLDPGFVLSFGATLGILLGTPRLLPTYRRRAPGRAAARAVRALARTGAAMLAATACAEAALVPVGAALFARVTFAGLLLNFAAIPLMTVVQLAGAAALLASIAWPAAGDRLAGLAHWSARWLVESARLVEHAPWLSVEVRPPAWALVAAYYAGVLAALRAATRRAGIAMAVAAGAVLLANPDAAVRDAVPPPSMPVRVVVLDVAQGDATAILLPRGRALLVDAGGQGVPGSPAGGEPVPAAFDVGDRVVRPALGALGVRRLEALIVTHGDADHVLGAPAILRRVGARSVWEGAPVPPHAGLRALAALAAARGGTWRTVQAGDRERFGEVEIRVLHPPVPDWERQRVRNEDSVVLEVRIGEVSIVLPGDVGREGEAAIRPRLEPGRLVVLKAPHHGSATSSTPALLDSLRPAAVIVSAGRDNRFGHPHPDVVARYQARGTAVFSTAADGAVFVETDGRAVVVRGWLGRRQVFRR